MSDPVHAKIERARRVCLEAGQRFTPLRQHVLELIVEDGGAVKAYDLLSRLKPELGSPKPPTVYRALDFLSELGLVHRVEALNAFVACDHSHDDAMAEFFICGTCERIEERHAYDLSVDKPDGFTISRSVVEHYGTCADCVNVARA